MCGIAGWIRRAGVDREEALGIGEQMSGQLHHRGPDDAGIWYDSEAGVVLVHRRLSILDLSPAGHQPMVSASGRYVLVFNGEIYNHSVLREELETAGQAPPWRGHSDTETLLAAFEAWGVERTLKRTVGMFALALWDRQERNLFLARDRIGEKPLYYGFQNGVFLFGSELKALRQHPCFGGVIDRNALASYFRYQYVPAPYSIYNGIHKLLPGCYLKVSQQAVAEQTSGDALHPQPYWSLEEIVGRRRAQPFVGDETAALAQLEQLLSDAVRLQMVADVPVGAFLSGGIDSSTVVALMQAHSSRPVRTFTIGFYEREYNEAEYALAVAKHLATEHTELYVTTREAMEVVPLLPQIYDEPFADSSQIPTFLVCRLARQQVTVALSGDGGDELFGGYPRYFLATQVWQQLKRVPSALRTLLAAAVDKLPAEQLGYLTKVPPLKGWNARSAAHRKERMLQLLRMPSLKEVYRDRTSHWKEPADLVIGSEEPPTLHDQSLSLFPPEELHHWMMYVDMLTYLPDDILVKVDRAAMSVSLETRIPLLDHRVVEFIWSLPLGMKVQQGKGKWLLRQLLYRYVPPSLVERPKSGFGIPIDEWLRTGLREWAEDLLHEGRLRQEGYLVPDLIARRWQEHVGEEANWGYYLWDILMFEAWLRHYHAQ